jgi:hypothetical protein
VEQLKWRKEMYILASGDGENLDIFKAENLANYYSIGKFFLSDTFVITTCFYVSIWNFQANFLEPWKSVKLKGFSNFHFKLSAEHLFAGER